MTRAWALAAVSVCLSAALASASQSGVAANRDGVDVVGLTVDAMPEPLGIDNPQPRLAWRLQSARRGVLQTDYRVRVASRPEWILQGTGDLWDSGNVRSADPFAVYDGRPLKPRTRYYWSVRVATTGASHGGSSSRGWFETALGAADWQGVWIAGPERSLVERTPEQGLANDAPIRAAGEFCRPTAWPTVPLMTRVPKDQGECREVRPTPMFRKAFTVGKPVARARIYSSGLGYHDLSVNGVRASDRVLDPQFTDYSKTVLYTTVDVTSLVRPGENVITSELGSGKFDDAARTWDWGWHKAQWRATPRLRLDLYVTYTDGSEALVRSDDSWKVSVDGPTRYDSSYLGETYDARREIAGWKHPGYDDGRWSPARVVAAPAGIVRAQVSEPSRVVAERAPGTRTEPSPRVFVYDVGQNLTGWATVQVRAPAGTPVEIFYSEILGEDGRASTNGNGLVGGQLQTDYYITRGAVEERWAPRFTYKGFQYVQLSGPNGTALPEGVSVAIESVQQVWAGLRRTSTFRSSHPLVDRIHEQTDWSIQENNVSGITTDTPIYEKNAWTGDAQLTAGTFSTLYDTERLYRKQVQDMLDAQTAEGEVPHLAPSNVHYGYLGKPAFKPVDCCGATPPWDAFWFVVPWEGYRRYGDVRLLESSYPAMQRYLDEWVPRWTSKDGDSLAYTLTSGLGDWCAPKDVDPVISLSATAYYAHFARIAAEAARALGKGADAARYDALFTRIRADFNTKYLGADGIYREKAGAPFAQTAQILPLAFGLAPEERRRPLLARLVDDITSARGGNEYVGILGARYILPVLLEAGYGDVALTVATQTDYPSYGYWFSLGWTSLGEFWEDTSRSRSHHFFGSIVQSFYEDLAGIRALEPGYRKIEMRPAIPAGLDHVSATYDSVRGKVASAWRKTASGLQLDVTVPPGATAEVHVPASDRAAVREGGRPADTAEGVRFQRMVDGRAVYTVGSGEYHFVSPRAGGEKRARAEEQP